MQLVSIVFMCNINVYENKIYEYLSVLYYDFIVVGICIER